jgi:hypothetical protein
MLVLIATLALAFYGVAAAQRPAEARIDADPLVLLPPGLSIGTTRFGSGSLPPPDAPVTRRLEDAAAEGLRGFTLYVDWPTLEPSAGDYRFETLFEELDRLDSLGLRTFVNITVGDIGEYVVPAEYSDSNGGLADGVRLDDPELVNRFGAMVAALAPELLVRGVFALGLGNEIDDRLDGDHPDEREPYAAFVAGVNADLENIAPPLAVGVTLTARPHLTGSPTLLAMREAADFVAVNYAPIASDFFVLPPAAITSDFERVLASFGSGPVVIQELTCPSAVSMNASDAWQAACFEILFDVLLADPRVRFASVFSLEDFSGELCEAVRAALPLGGDVPEDFERRFLDYLCELGVLAPDGSTKPAWEVLLSAVRNAPRGRLDRLRERSARPGTRSGLLLPDRARLGPLRRR